MRAKENFGKLTDCTQDLREGEELGKLKYQVSSCFSSKLFHRDYFTPNLPVIRGNNFEQCLLFPQLSGLLRDFQVLLLFLTCPTHP